MLTLYNFCNCLLWTIPGFRFIHTQCNIRFNFNFSFFPSPFKSVSIWMYFISPPPRLVRLLLSFSFTLIQYISFSSHIPLNETYKNMYFYTKKKKENCECQQLLSMRALLSTANSVENHQHTNRLMQITMFFFLAFEIHFFG